MAHHCQAKDSFLDHPFSIVSAMEKGALNRYNNIWPFGMCKRIQSEMNETEK